MSGLIFAILSIALITGVTVSQAVFINPEPVVQENIRVKTVAGFTSLYTGFRDYVRIHGEMPNAMSDLRFSHQASIYPFLDHNSDPGAWTYTRSGRAAYFCLKADIMDFHIKGLEQAARDLPGDAFILSGECGALASAGSFPLASSGEHYTVAATMWLTSPADSSKYKTFVATNGVETSDGRLAYLFRYRGDIYGNLPAGVTPLPVSTYGIQSTFGPPFLASDGVIYRPEIVGSNNTSPRPVISLGFTGVSISAHAGGLSESPDINIEGKPYRLNVGDTGSPIISAFTPVPSRMGNVDSPVVATSGPSLILTAAGELFARDRNAGLLMNLVPSGTLVNPFTKVPGISDVVSFFSYNNNSIVALKADGTVWVGGRHTGNGGQIYGVTLSNLNNSAGWGWQQTSLSAIKSIGVVGEGNGDPITKAYAAALSETGALYISALNGTPHPLTGVTGTSFAWLPAATPPVKEWVNPAGTVIAALTTDGDIYYAGYSAGSPSINQTTPAKLPGANEAAAPLVYMSSRTKQ